MEVVDITCIDCGERHVVKFRKEDFFDWSEGKRLIKDAFSYLSADERELIKTGICPKCWEKMFGEDE